MQEPRVDLPKINVHRAAERFETAFRPGDPRAGRDGVQTWHSFSFGDHYDPGNVGFGALVAHNEETVRLGAGYPEHPHRDTEILTWVLSGSLVHEDSSGHRGIVHPGLAQRLSAGSGVVHAERNDAYRLDPGAPLEPVHFVQMWLRPDEPGTPPAYAARPVDLADLDLGWVPVASGGHPDAAVDLGSAGSTLWVTRLAPGAVRTLPDAARLHVFVTRGAVEVETVGVLQTGDALRVTGPAPLRVSGVAGAELLVWELAG